MKLNCLEMDDTHGHKLCSDSNNVFFAFIYTKHNTFIPDVDNGDFYKTEVFLYSTEYFKDAFMKQRFPQNHQQKFNLLSVKRSNVPFLTYYEVHDLYIFFINNKYEHFY